MEQIRDILDEIMHDCKMTQTQLGEEFGVKQPSVFYWMGGPARMHYRHLLHLSRMTGRSLEGLFIIRMAEEKLLMPVDEPEDGV